MGIGTQKGMCKYVLRVSQTLHTRDHVARTGQGNGKRIRRREGEEDEDGLWSRK
jgi:hypothetical protein